MKMNLDLGKAGLGLFGAGLAILAGIVEDKKMEYTVEKEVKKQLSGGDESEEKKYKHKGLQLMLQVLIFLQFLHPLL